MSLADRTPVITDGFTGYADGNLDVNPGWLTLTGTYSPIVHDGTDGIYSNPDPLPYTAMVEGNYPLNHYAGIRLYDSVGSATAGTGAGVLLRTTGQNVFGISTYQIMANNHRGDLTIYRHFEGSYTTLDSASHTFEQGNGNAWIWAEVESDGVGGCDLRIYDEDENLILETNDPVELTGVRVGVILKTDAANNPSILYFESGLIDTLGNRRLDDVNGNFQALSNGTFIANGSGLSGVTGGNISYLDQRAYPITIASALDATVDIEPIDIHSTSLEPITSLKLTLNHPEGPLSVNFLMLPEDGAQTVELSGATGNYIDKDIGAIDGDFIEIPTTVGFSSVELFEDGDVHYDGAVNQGTTHIRWLFDKSASTWESGDVTINQTGVGLSPPSWRSTPSPPDATVGVPYLYEIGYLLDGDRPMILSDVGTPLPYGLTYNDLSYPETIEGTITSGSGTITVSGIITQAENSA